MIKAILFDFDGTLANTIPGIIETCRVTKEKMNADFSLDHAKSIIGKPLVDMGKELVGEERSAEFFNTYLSAFPNYGAEMVSFFDGAEALLKELHSKELLIAVVTSKRLDSLKANLEHMEGNAFFDLLVTNNETVHHKPHPEPLEYALDRLGIEAKEALMVGDTGYDLLAAEGAGVKSIGVTWGICTKEELSECHPAAIATTFDELRAIINSML